MFFLVRLILFLRFSVFDPLNRIDFMPRSEETVILFHVFSLEKAYEVELFNIFGLCLERDLFDALLLKLLKCFGD